MEDGTVLRNNYNTDNKEECSGRSAGAIHVEWGGTWAWFECPHCGMRYRRSDPEQSFEEYLKKPCISDRGFIFEKRLKECLSSPELSLSAAADLLGVGANTIGRYAKKSGIDVKKRRKASYYSRDADDDEDKTAYYRRRVQEELQKTPVMSCKDIKERIPGAYGCAYAAFLSHRSGTEPNNAVPERAPVALNTG